MKIIELRAENIKRLVAVTIKPDGNVVEITGKNGQGKTSVLDAIWWALEGQKNIQSVPIRKGQASAKIKLDLGELKITRTFSQAKDRDTKEPTGDYTTSIIVENAEGARFPSPQSVIDKLLGALSFDPLAFTRMKPGEQFDTLKQFVPGVDFDALDRANKGDFDRRTDLNRQAKELRARESGVQVFTDLPEAVDESALVAELEEAGRKNAEIEKTVAQRKSLQASIDLGNQYVADRKTRIERLHKEIGTIQEEINNRQEAIIQEKLELEKVPSQQQPVSTADITEKLKRARALNRQIEANDQAKADKVQFSEQAAVVEKRAAELTAALETRKKQKADAIAAAKLPIEGIGFGDGIVLLNGVPFDQASDAEQLRASINIAAAMNPKLRVIRVRDGSLLDDDAMKLLAEFADATDMQVWIERVDSTGKVGFVLEDGHVRETADALA